VPVVAREALAAVDGRLVTEEVGPCCSERRWA